ncbi:hypothetical protein ACVIN2_004752 [Bradyrhizobium sp. USDA 3650]
MTVKGVSPRAKLDTLVVYDRAESCFEDHARDDFL